MSKESATFYEAKILVELEWTGTPDELFAQWDSTFNDVTPPPPSAFATNQELFDYLEEFCDHDWPEM